MDGEMAGKMTFFARIGHPCGSNFKAQAFLDAHPIYNWQSPALIDMDAGPWSQYRAGEHAPAAAASNATTPESPTGH
jgi:hypothetical protein